ncbi:hypothetical protein SAMN04487991_1603 [Celeribacter neptunius]|uniref:Uncharacterized protein n=2 Tax=Celeribacter neptunius TaxID=588602 RepID=A0A1I3P9A6_9RHOB|nr:hypothetical protein SAMN04487991_1603 [Celeribacter neptunius]
MVLKALSFALLVLPWAAVPLCGWFALKDRWSFAVILALHLCLGAWVLFYGTEFLAAHGKLTGGPSAAIASALTGALTAFALSLAVTGATLLWRRRRGDV